MCMALEGIKNLETLLVFNHGLKHENMMDQHGHDGSTWTLGSKVIFCLDYSKQMPINSNKR
jgi:hypothetical protein